MSGDEKQDEKFDWDGLQSFLATVAPRSMGPTRTELALLDLNERLDRVEHGPTFASMRDLEERSERLEERVKVLEGFHAQVVEAGKHLFEMKLREQMRAIADKTIYPGHCWVCKQPMDEASFKPHFNKHSIFEVDAAIIRIHRTEWRSNPIADTTPKDEGGQGEGRR